MGNGKFICADDGNIYIDSCAAGETAANVWALMSSVEMPMESGCKGDEEGSYQEMSCDSDKRVVMTDYEDDATCKDFKTKMAMTKTCRNHDIETGDSDQTTTYPISLACDGSNMLMTLCSDDAKIITDKVNDYLSADYVEYALFGRFPLDVIVTKTDVRNMNVPQTN